MTTDSSRLKVGRPRISLPLNTSCLCQTCGAKLSSDLYLLCRPCAHAGRRKINTKVCPQCQIGFSLKPSRLKKATFCSRKCTGAYTANHLTNKQREARQRNMLRLTKEDPAFTKRWERMKGAGNPIHQPGVREKISAALMGRWNPHLNGGNGTGLTLPQRALWAELPEEWVAEFVVWAKGKTTFEWPIMIVDLAYVEKKWAVEVDGASHNTLKVRERDQKKDKLLREAGWRVYRVTNEEVNADPKHCASNIREFFGWS